MLLALKANHNKDYSLMKTFKAGQTSFSYLEFSLHHIPSQSRIFLSQFPLINSELQA